MGVARLTQENISLRQIEFSQNVVLRHTVKGMASILRRDIPALRRIPVNNLYCSILANLDSFTATRVRKVLTLDRVSLNIDALKRSLAKPHKIATGNLPSLETALTDRSVFMHLEADCQLLLINNIVRPDNETGIKENKLGVFRYNPLLAHISQKRFGVSLAPPRDIYPVRPTAVAASAAVEAPKDPSLVRRAKESWQRQRAVAAYRQSMVLGPFSKRVTAVVPADPAKVVSPFPVDTAKGQEYAVGVTLSYLGKISDPQKIARYLMPLGHVLEAPNEAREFLLKKDQGYRDEIFYQMLFWIQSGRASLSWLRDFLIGLEEEGNRLIEKVIIGDRFMFPQAVEAEILEEAEGTSDLKQTVAWFMRFIEDL